MSGPLKPGETPDEIAKRMREEDCPGPEHGNKVSMFDVLAASDCWKCVAAALKSYGDRRGEEERAKALERVGALEKQLSEWRVAISRHLTATKNAPPTAVHCEACELADGGWCRSCAPLAALLGQPALAAAPFGGAPAVQRGDGSVYFDRLVEARAPSGDAKGTP